MLKRLLLIILLATACAAAIPVSGAFARTDGSKKPAVGFIFKIFKHRPDSVQISRLENLQDTSRKKIKEIAPAKRQPKPERVDEPEEGRPGINSRPGFPGTDNLQPHSGGLSPREGSGARDPRGALPQNGGHGSGARPQGGGSSGPGHGGGGRPGG